MPPFSSGYSPTASFALRLGAWASARLDLRSCPTALLRDFRVVASILSLWKAGDRVARLVMTDVYCSKAASEEGKGKPSAGDIEIRQALASDQSQEKPGNARRTGSVRRFKYAQRAQFWIFNLDTGGIRFRCWSPVSTPPPCICAAIQRSLLPIISSRRRELNLGSGVVQTAS